MADIKTFQEWSPDEAQATRWSNGTIYIDPVKNADNGIEVHVNNSAGSPVNVTITNPFVKVRDDCLLNTASYDTGFVSIDPILAYVWHTVSSYTLRGTISTCHMPINFKFETGATSPHFARIVEVTTLGSWSKAGGFVDGAASLLDNEFWTEVAAEVSVLPNVNTTFTVTYTNQDGTTGRTGTIAVVKDVTGQRPRMVFQAGDYAAKDITAVTQSPTITQGTITIYGYKGISSTGGGDDGPQSVVLLHGIAMRGTRVMRFEVASSSTSSFTGRLASTITIGE
jgi:hypothetical protein